MADDQVSEPMQLSLFAVEKPEPEYTSRSTELQLQPDATLEPAIGAFARYMANRGFSQHTQQAFRLDMLLLRDYLGPAAAMADVSTATLNAFLKWVEAAGNPRSPKTLERRVTTLKVFFGWLADKASCPGMRRRH